MKLWNEKEKGMNKKIEMFTVGNDFELDEKLLVYDVVASIAHAAMLKKIGILKQAEFDKLKKALKQILVEHKAGKFKIKLQDEDVHTAIENYLSKNLGVLGKKIHAARSRNDQVLVDLYLYTKKELLETKSLVLKLCESMAGFAQKHEFTAMPGYTHMQKAMPSSVGLWMMSFVEGLLDSLKLVDSVYKLNNQCPLGSAAGYGTSIPIDRAYTAKLLGFSKVINNALYVQNSRAKHHASSVFTLSLIMNDLRKLATDLLLFTMSEFNYFKLPPGFYTGSSIMPQKKNVDVMELMKAKAASVNAKCFEIISIGAGLPSGFNRDLQLSKASLMDSFEITKQCLEIMDLIVSNLKVSENNLQKACTKELFATDKVNEMVMKGVAFRDAYKKVAQELDKLKGVDKQSLLKNIKAKKHIGAPGSLGIRKAVLTIGKQKQELKRENFKFIATINKLVGGKIGF